MRFSARRILVLVSLAFALSSLISFISMFPQVTYLVMLAVLPAASAGLCLLGVRESDRNRSEGPSSGCELPVPAKPAKGTYSLVAVLAVFRAVGFSIRGSVAPLEASAPLAEAILANAATLVIGLVAALMGWRMRSAHACVTRVTRFIMVGLFAALCLSIILGTSPVCAGHQRDIAGGPSGNHLRAASWSPACTAVGT